MTEMPVIDGQLCNKCGLCIEVCPAAALIWRNGEIVFRPWVDCDYCGICEAACPPGAISCAYEIVLKTPSH